MHGGVALLTRTPTHTAVTSNDMFYVVAEILLAGRRRQEKNLLRGCFHPIMHAVVKKELSTSSNFSSTHGVKWQELHFGWSVCSKGSVWQLHNTQSKELILIAGNKVLRRQFMESLHGISEGGKRKGEEFKEHAQ
jgi:hypothetical protein